MDYHVGRNGTQLGIFNDDQLREGIANRSIELTDLVWCESMEDWAPVSEIVEIDAEEAVAETSATTEKLEMPVAMQSTPSVPPDILPAANEEASVAAVPPTPPPTPAPAVQPVFTGVQTSGAAIASLVLGLFSFLGLCLTGIPAIIFGHIALGRINRSNGMIGGKGMATAGLIMGYVLGLFGGLIAVLAGLALPAFSSVQDKAKEMQASSNVRQIIIALKGYAGDNAGLYPDSDKVEPPQTANDAFRLLIKQQFLSDEKVFTCYGSPFKGDNEIGTAPDYAEALKPGENHWAMTKGISGSSRSNLPLVFENPTAATWPPTWNADAKGQPLPGRAWKSGKVIIGMNDGSVAAEKLASMSGTAVPLPLPRAGGTPIFDPTDPHEILLPAQP